MAQYHLLTRHPFHTDISTSAMIFQDTDLRSVSVHSSPFHWLSASTRLLALCCWLAHNTTPVNLDVISGAAALSPCLPHTHRLLPVAVLTVMLPLLDSRHPLPETFLCLEMKHQRFLFSASLEGNRSLERSSSQLKKFTDEGSV